MLGKFFECDEDNKVNLNATKQSEMGGFCISTYEYIFRWLIRGDTLCEVKIPKDTKIYKTISENGIYVSEKIILTNPKIINNKFAMELYEKSKLPEISYFKAMTACAICGYINTALKVCEDKVNKENVDIAISEIEDFCQKGKNENCEKNFLKENYLKKIYDKLLEIKIS